MRLAAKKSWVIGPFLLLALAPAVSAADLSPCVKREVSGRYADLSGQPWLGARARAVGAGEATVWHLDHIIPGGALFHTEAEHGAVITAIEGYELPRAPADGTVRFVSQLVPASHGNGALTLHLVGQDERTIEVSPQPPPPSVFYEILGLTILEAAGWRVEGDAVSPPPDTEKEECLAREIRERISGLRETIWLGSGHSRILWQDGSSHWELLDIVPGGPLAAAGVKDGDSVIGLDGVDLSQLDGPIASPLVRKTVGAWQPGQVVELRLRRGITELDVTVTLGRLLGGRLASRLGARLLRDAGILYAGRYYRPDLMQAGPGARRKRPSPPGSKQ